MDSRSTEPHRQVTPATSEKLVGLIGLLLVVFLLGYLLLQAVSGNDTYPEISVEVRQVVEQPNGFLLVFEARNSGGQTAADVEIEGELRLGDETVEQGRATLDFVPSHSVRTGGLFFSSDPRVATLVLRATGYSTP